MGSQPSDGVFIKAKSIRALLLVKGNVQRVGYRVFVRQIADKMGIKGKIRNLEDGNVEIYCGGQNIESVSKFIKAINVHSKSPENIFERNVEKIEGYWEGEEGHEEENGYIKLDEEMGRFKIDYGGESPESINNERLEVGSLMMLNLGQEIGNGFSTTHSDFQELDNKYDVVSTELKSINKNISQLDSNVSKLVDHLGTIVETFVENRMKK
ncbi:MAG TPA: acylphosphatase [Euryarchaeota archaeon]|nr:acylphosphatase [Euryarchaeota archaeon]